MTQDGTKRKLAAILSADVKGYSILSNYGVSVKPGAVHLLNGSGGNFNRLAISLSTLTNSV
jgi:hypothetical protein